MADLTLDLIGQTTPQSNLASRQAEADLAESTSFGETVGAAFSQNIGPQLWNTLDQKFSHRPEEGFDPQEWIQQNASDIPQYLHDRFSGTRSAAEAAELSERLTRDIQDQEILQAKGATGVAAQMLAGMVDIDLPLTLMSGGTTKAATTAGRLAEGALRGGTAGVALGAVDVGVNPLSETADIVNYGLFGTVFGGAGGLALSKSTKAAADEFNEARADGLQFTSPEEFRESDRSLGAAYRGLDDIDETDLSDGQKAELERSRETLRTTADIDGNTVSDLLEDTQGTDDAAGKAGRRLGKAIQSTPGLRALFDDVAAGGSIMKAAAYDLLESPAGRVRNNRSASAYDDHYRNRLGTMSADVNDVWDDYAKSSQLGIRQRHDGTARDAFDRLVLRELDDRAWDVPEAQRTQDPHIKEAADRMDAYYKEDAQIKQGLEGETSLDGADSISHAPGHYTRQWDGASMRGLIRKGVKRSDIEEMISIAYRKAHPELKAKGHDKVVAKAIVRRALSKEDGVDSGMLMTLNSDGQEFMRQMLKDSGYTDEVFDDILTGLKGKAEERGMLGTNKARIQLDMRTEHNGLSMYDLIDTNLNRTMDRNTRRTAGASALARKGITNRAQQKQLIDAAVAEMVARGDTNVQKHRETMENMFTYFNGGLIAGGVNPWISRMRSLSSLALLNQMGLTQLGETGAQIAGVGMETWKHHAKAVFTGMGKAGKDSPLAKELQVFSGRLGEEHNLFRPEYSLLDEMQGDTGFAMELEKFISGLDVAMGKGRRLQGYISGFYFVKGTQQKIAVQSMADKVFQHIKAGTGERQMQDIGIDPAQFKKYLDKVEWNEAGFADRLHMEDWDPVDAQDFAMALNRYSRQVVQQGMIGEDSQWWHTSMGAFFGYLKTFPLMAMQKQAARNLNMGSPQAVAMITMGLATAGTAYTAKQLINGKDMPTTTEMAKGAFGMSNMTGWFPMLFDPAAAILGMNDFRFNQFGRQTSSSGILPIPAMVPTLNRMAHIPSALLPTTQTSRNERISALKAAPLIGNAYGFSAIFNALRK